MVISAILICLTGILAYFTHKANSTLDNDARIINSAGIVRGSIQRLVKLELNHCDKVCEGINNTVDKSIEDILSLMSFASSGEAQTAFTERFQKLNQTWLQLKDLLDEYKENPTDANKQRVLQLSEYCWEIADSAVLLAQLSTESKMGLLKYFYPIALLIVIFNILTIVVAYLNVGKELEYLATFDNLTNVYNRYSFRKILYKELLRAERYSHGVALIYFDIDHFKAVNDEHGHQTGDTILKEIGKLATSTIRQTDSIARIGGEEFAIIAPEIDQDDAARMAEKIRSKIEEHSFSVIKQLTVSIGIAHFRNGITTDELIEEADKALYKAKEKGRNKVVNFPNINISK